MARLHWFWRAMIGFLSGAVVSALYWMALFSFQRVFMGVIESICRVLGATRPERGWQSAVAYTVVISTPGLVVSVLVATFLYRWSKWRPDTETRCRKCGYILKGISEPRCSECGERI